MTRPTEQEIADNIERVEWTLRDPNWTPTRSYLEKMLASYKELAAAQSAPQDWRPIETAPPTQYGTGPHILLWDGFTVFEGFKNGEVYVTAETMSARPHVKCWQPKPLPPPPAAPAVTR